MPKINILEELDLNKLCDLRSSAEHKGGKYPCADIQACASYSMRNDGYNDNKYRGQWTINVSRLHYAFMANVFDSF